MNGTKKGFMIAGSVIAIVVAAFAILAALILLGARSLVDTEFVVKVINEMNASLMPEEQIDVANADMIVNLVRTIMMVGILALIVLAVVNIVFGSKVIGLAKAESNKKGSIITLLVFGVLSGNILVVAFMIVSLCLKFKEDKPATPEIQVEVA